MNSLKTLKKLQLSCFKDAFTGKQGKNEG